ncbi:polysaccharide deacetylase family protein [Streptomyces wuyuanensis]|uniref:Peptidoglycan/xylan/chitin deacetylase, PgdA/CDA1 family n=1 Tax=Streptomyces wuyuanensis TaxID=1196353 RepID=A0A1H0DKN5_9ACTN|nr:polysaccharide deacetylase family protein [Streptomyces wuyuanensis]SDN70619.1 Peptidoglycan/xylan/chitin deacetylase, PgdA/CDA1 family [Streptomyces wuyuanensis]
MPESRKKSKVAAVAAAVAALALTLGGCSMETTSPSAARDSASDAASLSLSAAGGTDCAKAKCIALTFDAGPGKHTPELLDTLKEKKVHATFFLLGKNHVLKHPDVVRRIAAEGHEVANHTWSHRRLDELDTDEIRNELSRTQEAIAKITGLRPTLMRPPQGRTNDDVTQVSRELGLAQILWSATAKDYSTTDSELIKSRILDQAGRDGIILLHDIYDGTVPAVPGIIDELKKRGYTFVTVPELLAPCKANPGEVYRP